MKRLGVLLAALLAARLAAGQVSSGVTPIQSLANAAPILFSRSTVPETLSNYTVRTSVREVRVSFAVDDKHGRPVTKLVADDLRLFDSGKQVAKINSLQVGNSLPLRIVFMIDTSESTAKMLALLKAIAPDFLNSVFKPGIDQAMLASFNTNVTRQQEFTSDAQLIANSLDLVRSGGLTSLYDSLLSVVKTEFRAESTEPERRLIILLSDGLDNYSTHSRDEVLRELNRLGVTLYAVFVGPKDMPVSGTSTLDVLAEFTGGKAFFPPKPKEFAPAFASIERDLRTQYHLTFRPAEQGDGGFHVISIKPRPGLRWKVRARAGYITDAEDGTVSNARALVAAR